MSFPADFTWGAATSSYQVEGAAEADGKGPSIWDAYTARRPSPIFRAHDGRVACDHYHRYGEDVALMRELGIGAYRMSISWPRVMPTGTGAVNEAGLAFYDRLIDTLLAAGVTPWVTLYHWDLPQALDERGGWRNPDMPQWFADYATVVADRLSDRVRHWMTINEPQVFIDVGHRDGGFAPGLRLPMHEVLRAGHHVLLAHGRAVQVLRARSRHVQPTVIGWAPTSDSPIPDTPADLDAARLAFAHCDPGELFNAAWWNDPVYLGRYPESGLKAYGAAAPVATDAEMKLINQPLDFAGINIYRGVRVSRDGAGFRAHTPAPGNPCTAIDWDITPECLYWGPRWYHERYRLPIVITENGMAGLDSISPDGAVHDSQRIDYLRSHLAELRRAGADGVPLMGYFQWTFLDNFEWMHGYRRRFGLVHVDYQTQVRTPKDSFHWYRQVIASNGMAMP